MMKPGQMVKDRYVVKELLGEGGMSRVFLAEDSRLHGRLWAVKQMMHSGTDEEQNEMKNQFEREAQILCRLNHPNLPRVGDYFSEGQSDYLVMEYIEGETLFDILQKTEGFIDEETLRTWGVALSEALHYLHSQEPPIIYRDIKPKNIIRTPDGKIKLIDFGIARFYDLHKVSDTIIIGTPGFASPEQYGKGQTDQRSDIYSLGATLYNLGTRLDPSDNPFCFSVPSTVNINLSDAFDNALLKALNLRPRDRFQSALEFRDALSLRHTTVLPFMAAPSESSLSLEFSEQHLVFELENQGRGAEGTLTIRNTGGKFLKASVSSNRSWIKVAPDYFEANQQSVAVIIDLTGEKRNLKHRGKILIETEERTYPIQVSVNVKPTIYDFVIPRKAVSAFLVGQSFVPLAAPFTVAYTYILFDKEEKSVQKYPAYVSFGIAVINALHFIGII
ncbi:MAG: serine/threonine-protein kinase [Candidatus Eremiobacteraeota bacterium]|nr:serine/threonine-protein kinase [Candidatus Eremiobacteraeota bacterium]